MKILIINGSYRESGFTDQAVSHAAETLRLKGQDVELVCLRNLDMGFCTNCRQCTQQPGDALGTCVQRDDMATLVEKLEEADAYILASPTNLSSVTAVFKRFMERLLVYAYWPWGQHIPQYRKKRLSKRAMLITSSAAPDLIARVMFGTRAQLKLTAKIIGAKVIGTVSRGKVAKHPLPSLSVSEALKIDRQLERLIKKS